MKDETLMVTYNLFGYSDLKVSVWVFDLYVVF